MFGLDVTCLLCGEPLGLVTSTSSGTQGTAVLGCGPCGIEWMVAMQMRRLPKAPKYVQREKLAL